MKYKILVVEDSIPVAEAIKNLLIASGYSVTTAGNGKEALSILDQDKPHLIISDIMMPVMDGLEFYASLRQNADWHDIPFIFLTARGQQKDIRDAKKLGVDDYIKKPFSSEDLLAVVQGKIVRMEALLEHTFRKNLSHFREEIIKSLSHEFRTPLTKIQGYVDLIVGQMYQNDDQLKSFANQISDSSKQLEGIIEEFITLTRFELEANNELGTIDPEIVDAQTVGQGAVQKVQKIASTRKIDLRLFQPEVPLPLTIRKNDVCEALYHLLLNAVKFSNQGNFVNFRIFDENGATAVFEVQDFGPGIDSEHFSKLFDKFYQVNRSENEQQGLGLGLSITKMAAEKNNGTIHVGSKLGEGTTFQLRFPVATTGSAPAKLALAG